MTIGGISKGYEGADFVELPILQGTNDPPWSTTISSLIWGDGEELRVDFDNAAAVLHTTDSFLAFPGNIANRLLDLVGAHEPDGFFKSFPCEKRDRLPTLTLLFGDKQIILDPYDYSFVISSSSKNASSCVVAFF